jgi:hypothetical protein
MRPVPEPIATNPTATINTISAHSKTQDGQRDPAADVFGNSLFSMAKTMAIACGFGLTIALVSLSSTASRANSAALAATANTSADPSGRWNGTPNGYAEALKNCGPKGCSLTVDITACGNDWCGVRVEQNGRCSPGVALRMTQKNPEPSTGVEESRSEQTPSFKGTFELASNSQPFEIEAMLWTTNPAVAPQLRMIGDTGGELRMLRRSFPLQATLARVGDAICKSDKPVS